LKGAIFHPTAYRGIINAVSPRHFAGSIQWLLALALRSRRPSSAWWSSSWHRTILSASQYNRMHLPVKPVALLSSYLQKKVGHEKQAKPCFSPYSTWVSGSYEFRRGNYSGPRFPGLWKSQQRSPWNPCPVRSASRLLRRLILFLAQPEGPGDSFISAVDGRGHAQIIGALA
jgi:hypothetical protein